jgi:hypothetical protein
MRPDGAPVDAISLRNRLLVATTTWREAVREPLPRMPPGDPEQQIEAFELTLVERLFALATPDTAPEIADRTWGLVHDRPDEDAVKQRVVTGHEDLARLQRRRL